MNFFVNYLAQQVVIPFFKYLFEMGRRAIRNNNQIEPTKKLEEANEKKLPVDEKEKREKDFLNS